MSNIDRDLILHWLLDAVEGSQVADISVSGNNGILRGAPEVVEDAIFGRCLRFNGSEDGVTLGFMLEFPDSELTVSCWVKSMEKNDKGTLVSYVNSEESNAFVLLDHRNLTVYVGRKYERNTRISSCDGLWHHLAVCWRSSDGMILIYKDGFLSHTGKLAPGKRIRPGGSLIIAQDQDEPGGKTDPDQAFKGEMANLRIHRRMLAASEIEQLMQADVARVPVANVAARDASGRFAAGNPLNLRLLDENNNNAIYIDTHHEGQKLFLEVQNVSANSLILAESVSPEAGPQNFHFQMLFRPGTLSQISADHMLVDQGRWTMTSALDKNGLMQVFLLSETRRILHPGEKLSIELSYISAASLGSSRMTQVEMIFGNLFFQGSKTPLSGYLNSPLHIVDLRGQVNIPLHVGFVGSNAVLNRGAGYPNTLTLEIANAAMAKALTFYPEGSEVPTRLILSADVQPPEQNREWALGTVDEVAAIAPEINDTRWKKISNEQGETPEWIFTPTEKILLLPGEMLRMTLNSITSSLPSGSANFYLRYEHIPGYRDGQFVLPVQKGPISIKDLRHNGEFTGISRVGINTTDPRSALDTGDGLISGAAQDYTRAQMTLSGGGTVTWQGPGGLLSWTKRFLAIGMERSRTFADGYVDIVPPAGPLPQEWVYNGQPRNAGPGGVQLNNWEALYAVHRVGGGHGNTPGDVTFRIVHYSHVFHVPSNWLLVAVVNGDDATVKLGTGLVLAAGSSSSSGSSIPVGTIVMWSGAANALPGGWALCDGQNGTPNLLDRFIVGAGGSYGVGTNGGANSVVLDVSQMPVHNHTAGIGSAGGHAHTLHRGGGPVMQYTWAARSGVRSIAAGDDNNAGASIGTNWTGDHNHGISINAAGASQPHENRPPYYALAFIMKL